MLISAFVFVFIAGCMAGAFVMALAASASMADRRTGETEVPDNDS